MRPGQVLGSNQTGLKTDRRILASIWPPILVSIRYWSGRTCRMSGWQPCPGFYFGQILPETRPPRFAFSPKTSPASGKSHLTANFILKKINFIKNCLKPLTVNGLRQLFLFYFKKTDAWWILAIWGFNPLIINGLCRKLGDGATYSINHTWNGFWN